MIFTSSEENGAMLRCGEEILTPFRACPERSEGGRG